MMKLEGIVICSGGMVDVEGVPEEIKILPLGHVHSQKGDFEVDDESVELIRKQFKSRKLDLVIDYEHQTLKDVQAPAGGWIEDIYKGEDAVVAKVKWTDKAKEYLRNREYRYLSPPHAFLSHFPLPSQNPSSEEFLPYE
jgi:phage I-like protein